MGIKTKEVQVNERGRRIGESHPRARLTDHEIDLIRELAEEGMSYREIADKFAPEMKPYAGRKYVEKLVNCRLRAQTSTRTKRVKTAAAVSKAKSEENRQKTLTGVLATGEPVAVGECGRTIGYPHGSDGDERDM